MVVTTSSDGARMRAGAPAPAGPPAIPGLRGLVSDPATPRLWLGWMEDEPVRVLLIESGRIPFDPVVAALERLRPATEHRFASRLLGCHVLAPNGLAVVTDHHPLGSLERVVARSGPGTEAEALSMAAEVCEALAHCHGAGFVHGHIGPGTVMLGEDGHPRLSAHGALGELEAGLGVRPTPPGIVPPEGRPSAAGDVYAVALLAVYAATGMLDPRAMPKRWAPLVGPALDVDPARRPNDLRMFGAGMRSVADALLAGSSVAVIDVPRATSAAAAAGASAGGVAAGGVAVDGVAPMGAGGAQVVVDGLQLNKVPRRSGRRMAVLASSAVLATAGVAAGAIYVATQDDESPATVPVSTVVSVANPASATSAAPPPVTTAPAPVTTSPVTTVPATPATEVPVTTDEPATTAAEPPTTRRTTTRASTTRATTPTTRTSTPSSSPDTTSASTLPPDVERGKD